MIGERLKYARKRAGISQKDLAEACGVTRQMLGRYDHNRDMPRPKVLKAICETLNVTPEWLLGQTPLEPEPKLKRQHRYTLKEAVDELRSLGFKIHPPT